MTLSDALPDISISVIWRAGLRMTQHRWLRWKKLCSASIHTVLHSRLLVCAPTASRSHDSMPWSTAPTRSTRSGGRNSLAVSHPASGAKQSIEIKSTETVDMPIHEDQPMEDVLPTDGEEDMDIEEGVTNVRLVETPVSLLLIKLDVKLIIFLILSLSLTQSKRN